MMATGFVFPKISFAGLDYTKIQSDAFFIGFNVDYSGSPLCKMDNAGTITIIEGAGSSNFEFYYQDTAPTAIDFGAKWIDSTDGTEYTWIDDGDTEQWIQSTQINARRIFTFEISGSSASVTFNFGYYGVTNTSGICTITLPTGVSPGDDGRSMIVKDESGTISGLGRGINVNGSGGQDIDGTGSYSMTSDYEKLTLVFRNSAWFTV